MKRKIKLSTMILWALTDMEKCEADPRYTINMGSWHTPELRDEQGTVCHVCMAGSVMAQRMVRDHERDITFRSREVVNSYPQITVLDQVRMYDLEGAVEELDDDEFGYNFTKTQLSQVSNFQGSIRNINCDLMPSYNTDPELFYENMQYIAGTLQSWGM